jgi:hypothetical protein
MPNEVRLNSSLNVIGTLACMIDNNSLLSMGKSKVKNRPTQVGRKMLPRNKKKKEKRKKRKKRKTKKRPGACCKEL